MHPSADRLSGGQYDRYGALRSEGDAGGTPAGGIQSGAGGPGDGHSGDSGEDCRKAPYCGESQAHAAAGLNIQK